MIKLPSFLKPAPPPPPVVTIEPAPKDKTCVLLVDDELAIRMLFATSLRRDGYHVVEAANGEEAVAAAKKAERVDLVVTDIRMPKMDGVAMAKALREAQPDIRIVFVSGYPVDLDALGPNSTMLSKPFLRADLMKAVHELTPNA
jgi:two-component system cell cycle sensor histidine kinase/response regulator CckA